MVVYILFSQRYISWEYGYEHEIVSVYQNREDAEKERDRLDKQSTLSYYVEMWSVE